MATDADVLALLAHVADLQQRVIQSQSDAAVARAELNRLMGSPDRQRTARRVRASLLSRGYRLRRVEPRSVGIHELVSDADHLAPCGRARKGRFKCPSGVRYTRGPRGNNPSAGCDVGSYYKYGCYRGWASRHERFPSRPGGAVILRALQLETEKTHCEPSLPVRMPGRNARTSPAVRGELMDRARFRLEQEIARLRGDYAHVLTEEIEPRHDDRTGEAWVYGRFDYELYRRKTGPQRLKKGFHRAL
jgi:hypothetical protein